MLVQENYLTPADLLQRFHVAVQTAANWRWMGKGPSFIKTPSGRVLYRETDVVRWLLSGQAAR